MHLAAVDLSVGLLYVSTDLVWKLTVTWEADLLACKVIRFLQVVITYGLTCVLVALSIDRYDAITHPMNFSGSWKRAIIFQFNLHENPEYETQCWIDFPESGHWSWCW